MENAALEKNEETVIKFGGFYDSRFSAEIDYRIESDIDEGYYDSWEKVDFPMTYQIYIENYCNELRNFIFQEFDLDINFKKINLWSPREYNFRTDEINCEISKKPVNKLNEYFLKNKEFDKFLFSATQHRDGFHSFFTYEEAKNNRKEILSTYVLEFIADKFYEIFEPIEFEIHLKDD